MTDLITISASLGQAAITVAILSFAIVFGISTMVSEGNSPFPTLKSDTVRFVYASLFVVVLWCLGVLYGLAVQQASGLGNQTVLKIIVGIQATLTLIYAYILLRLVLAALKKIG